MSRLFQEYILSRITVYYFFSDRILRQDFSRILWNIVRYSAIFSKKIVAAKLIEAAAQQQRQVLLRLPLPLPLLRLPWGAGGTGRAREESAGLLQIIITTCH